MKKAFTIQLLAGGLLIYSSELLLLTGKQSAVLLKYILLTTQVFIDMECRRLSLYSLVTLALFSLFNPAICLRGSWSKKSVNRLNIHNQLPMDLLAKHGERTAAGLPVVINTWGFIQATEKGKVELSY